MANLSFLDIGIPTAGRLVFRPIYPQEIEERQNGGGIPGRKGKAKRKRDERVYVKVNDRTLWFKNPDNARAYLRTREKELTEKLEREARDAVAEIIEKRTESSITEPVDWRAIPVEIPTLDVRGNAELEEMAREIETRFYAQLMAMEERRQRLIKEDELLLLS